MDLLAILADLPGRQTRLDRLLAEARRWPRLPETARTDPHRVPGCLSRLWLLTELREGRCWFEADSDSQIVRALAGLVCRYYRGRTAAEILNQPGLDLGALGLSLATTNRRNALSRVETAIRNFAHSQAPTPGGPPPPSASETSAAQHT